MPTIINSIAMCNFFNYYGDYEQNIYEFNAGLNVIVADNGAGKSKLFSAFSWILKDEVLDSDLNRSKNVPVKNFMPHMVSDKAKNETLINSEVTCGVRINFSDENFEYEVEKSFGARRVSTNSPTEKDTWSCTLNDIRVSKRDLILLDYRVVNNDSDEKKKIIHKLIRPEFLQYALLQGEEVDNILDFENKNSLKSAIDTLTNISKIESLINLSRYLAERGEAELTDAKKQTTRELNTFNLKVKEREELKTRLERKNSELNKYREDLIKAKNERDKLVNQLANAEKREQIRAEQRAVNRELQKLEKAHADFLNTLNDSFFDNQSAWLLYNTDHYEKSFHSLRDDYLAYKLQKKLIGELKENPSIFLTKLPEGSPDSYSLRKMLKEEVCFVCGREAKPDSIEWNHIKLVLEQHTPKKETDTPQDFNKFLDELMQSSSSYYNQITSINEGFTHARLKDKHFREDKQKLRASLEDAIQELIGLGENKPDSDKFTVNAYGGAEKRIERYEASIKSCENEIIKLGESIEQKNKEIDDLSSGKTKKEYLDRRDAMNDILSIAKTAKRRMFADIVHNLECNSNKFFKDLTSSNAVDGGIIRISANADDTFSIEIRDADNNKIYGLSEGFQRMKKLAVIMAIIASSDRGRMDYPLIADAPLSSFGKGFIQGFFEKVPDAFHQTIVLVKDLYDSMQPDGLTELGHDVLKKIRATSGSMHMNLINEKQPQILRETSIKRY